MTPPGAGRGTLSRRALLAAPLLFPAPGAQEEAGFTPLFDGETLRGWRVREGPESAFYVDGGAIVIHEGSGYPAWLASEKQYENFDLRLEFFMQGWSDSGLYLHAPEHGRPTDVGMQIKLFHQVDTVPTRYSMGSIFPAAAPLKVNVKQGAWNTLRVLADWPSLKVWVNGETVQDLDMERAADLRYRLRRGYLGIASLSYPLRFRNLRIRELPDKESWQTLYGKSADLEANWWISEGEPEFRALGRILRCDGHGHIATKEKYRDFVMQLYIRGQKHHNGGILFRSEGKGLKGRRYEIQLHDVEDAHFPTGSLYFFERAKYPRIQPEEWFLVQLFVEGPRVVARINGENVLDYGRLEDAAEGHVELQAHRKGSWLEFKHVRIRRLG